MKRMWELKQAAQVDTLDLYIYGDVEDVAIDWVKMTYVESENSAKFFREELGKHPDAKQINVFVNSPGGYVFEAMAIRNQLKRHPAHITGYVDGIAASAASFILTACDTVKMYSNTEQMIHNMWSVAIGNSDDLRKAAADLDVLMEGNRKAYLEKSGGKITEEKLIELMKEEKWLTAESCLEYGFCDEIITEKATEENMKLAKQMMQKENQSLEQHINYNQSLLAILRESLELFETQKPIEPAEPVEKAKEEVSVSAVEADPIKEAEPKENKTLKFMSALMR